MLQQWFNRDVGRAKLLNLVPQNRPTQSTRSSSVANNEDGVSCGVLTERGLAILCAISAAPEYAMSAGIDGS
ncbi:hypothetical protein PC116_g25664 [Phytophthora cactorum]|uniref:Uncharacterized protein n=1 Tax=Phytophthora cactorum TaxID=29920 RepID=A0A8T1JS65_9STRA|nr:hypothetical protein PC111_g22131 [Phytophthora cactorum]KAG2888472.1 hypothetical protein PC117_g24899 [Phytophthora cactorum]KAG3044847.1 hypothetical protein PC121_g21653 [Phytophthora cactorum]KAG3146560.1 hypothetical protein PC128_g23990 [Phytophthora cactorum]KAG4041008.1 hypothetical protein PC123_g23465 [Phytophthora cactorum]